MEISPEQLLQLEQQHASLLLDRAKMTQACEMMQRESRNVSREIHRLLEVLGELLPEDTCLASDFDSSADDEHAFAYSDGNDEDDCRDRAREEVILHDLRHKCEQAANRLRKLRERSPGKSAAKSKPASSSLTRRSYRSLPMNAQGAIELPLVLGRGLNRVSIDRLGEIRDAPTFQAEGYVFPCGYECRRRWLSPDEQGDDLSQASRRCLYVVIIGEEAGQALFTLAALDAQEGEQPLLSLSSALSLSELWEQFKSKLSPALLACLQQDFKSPEDFFGFDHENLRVYLLDQLEAIRAKLH